MPISNQELRDNYYLAVVVYLCDYKDPYTRVDPDTMAEWAVQLADNGAVPHPNPAIASWGVVSHEQPSDDLLEATVDMSMILSAQATLFPPPGESKTNSESVMQLLDTVRAQARKIQELSRPAPLAAATSPFGFALAPAPLSGGSAGSSAEVILIDSV